MLVLEMELKSSARAASAPKLSRPFIGSTTLPRLASDSWVQAVSVPQLQDLGLEGCATAPSTADL